MFSARSGYLATSFVVLERLWNVLFHQCVGLVVVYTIWTAILNFPHHTVLWHTILCTLGFMLVAIQSLIVFSPTNVWSQDFNNKGLVHGVLLGIGVLLVIIGVALGLDRYTEGKYINVGKFASAHGITGLIALILVLLAAVPLVLKMVLPPQWPTFIYNVLGHLACILATTSMCLGYYTDIFSAFTVGETRLAVTIITCLITAWALYRPFRIAITQLKAILYEA